MYTVYIERKRVCKVYKKYAEQCKKQTRLTRK